VAPRLVIVVVLPVLVAAGCGSNGPSLDEYASSAEEVCADHQRAADELAVGVAGTSVAESSRSGAELSRQEVEALAALDRPSEQRDAVDRWIDALGRRVTALEVYAGELAASDGAEPVAVPEDLASATTEAADLAGSLRLQACGAGIDVVVGSVTGSADSSTGTEVPTGPIGAAPDGSGAVPTSTPPSTGIFGNPTDETITQDQ